jgi:hypothetical protein
MLIYNPLRAGSILYETWSTAAARPAHTPAPAADARLAERYVGHLTDASADRKTRRTSVSAYTDASRPIVRDLRALLDVVTLDPPFDDLQSKSASNCTFRCSTSSTPAPWSKETTVQSSSHRVAWMLLNSSRIA